jgi:hypothetical protein
MLPTVLFRENPMKAKRVLKLTFALVSVVSLAGITGCGSGDATSDVPAAKEDKIKAIESNAAYSAEQKERYKKQVEDTDKMAARAREEAKKFAVPAPR